MGNKKKSNQNNKAELWTEEQYEEYMADLYGMDSIAGFTESGGTLWNIQ